MTIKITTPNGGSDSLDFGCAQTAIVATVTGTEVSSGEGKLELKTTTGGTSATKATVLANGNVGIGSSNPAQKLHVAHAGRLGLQVEATTTDIAEVLLKNTTETWGIKNEGGNLVIADESTGIMATMAKDTGVLTLAAPLPVASGGTGNTQGGQVVRNHYINSTGSAQNLGPTSTMTAVGCTANIPVTAGNILTVWWTVGVYTNAAAHWAGTAFLDSTSLGHGQWGDGIHNGSTTLTGWQVSTGQNRIVIPTTKTASLSLRMTCNAGSITIRKDGNLGYDGAWMIVQETTP